MSGASGPSSRVAVVHEESERSEALAHILRTAGHRVTLIVPGRRIVQQIIDDSPDLILASLTLIDPPMRSIVKEVRQALGADPQILVLYNFDPKDAPPDVDEVVRGEPLDAGELVMRVGRLLAGQAERRVLQR